MTGDELRRKSAKAVQIDLARLDQEWVDQPVLFHEFACLLADARRDEGYAKAELDLVKSEMLREIRSNPERFYIDKVTEGTVEAAVCVSKRYQDAKKKVIEAEHWVGHVKAIVDALDHKKKGLESAVYMHNSDYFSAPRVRGASERTQDLTRSAVRVGEKRAPKEGGK
jgi:hypothetical protein